MPRGPHTFADRKRIEMIAFRAKQLKEEVQVNGSGNVMPTREHLKSAAEKLVYEDVDWLLNRIEEAWE